MKSEIELDHFELVTLREWILVLKQTFLAF